MPARTRPPSLAGRTRRLVAVGVAATCWLALPAGASAQGLDVSGLTSAATGAVAATGSAVENTVKAAAPLAGPAQDTVTQVAGTVGRVTGPEGPVARVGASTAEATGSVVERVTRPAAPVAGAADRVVSGAQRVVDRTLRGAPGVDETLRGVDETLRGATGVDETLRGATPVDETLQGATGAGRAALRDSGSAGAAAGPGSPRIGRMSDRPARGESSQAAQLRLRGPLASERPGATFQGTPVSPILTALIPGPPIGLPGAPAGGGHTGAGAASGSGASDLPPGPEPVSGAAGGSSAAGASVSFSLGGLALLLATLSLAGPALRRRLPRRPVIAWPAAFVPLLERPG
jgi:hypothetical protein